MPSKSDDAFLYYSNDEVRLSTLKMDGGKPTTESSRQQRRKTRISFELHDSLVTEDLLEEMLGDDSYDDDFDFNSTKREPKDRATLMPPRWICWRNCWNCNLVGIHTRLKEKRLHLFDRGIR